MARAIVTLLFAALLATPAIAAGPDPAPNAMGESMRSLGGGLSPEALAAALAEADKHPLGSKENPVRVDMPQGERAYLNRLRCPSGDAPKYFRAGNVGTGVFGYVVDLYQVTCNAAAPVEIYMDMYHAQGEDRPVPGFTIVS